MPDDHRTATVDVADADPRSAATVVVGAVGVTLLAVVIILLEVLFQNTWEQEHVRKVVSQQPEELRSVQATQMETLNGYRWVDEQNGTVAIPIDRAMELLVKEDGGSTD